MSHAHAFDHLSILPCKFSWRFSDPPFPLPKESSPASRLPIDTTHTLRSDCPWNFQSNCSHQTIWISRTRSSPRPYNSLGTMFHLSIPISLPLPAYHPQILLRTSSPRSSFYTTQGHWVYCSCKSLDADPRLSDTVSQTLLLHQHSTFPGSTYHLCRTMSHFPAFCDFSMHPHILTHQNTCKELNKTICTQQVGCLLLRFPHELCVLLINLANSLEQVISHRVHKLPEMRQNPMRSNLLLYSIRSRSPRLFQIIQLPNIYMLNDLCFFFANVTCSPHSESI